MIPNSVYLYCCEDPSLIENYQEALNSSEIYECHHRKGTDEGYTKQELIDLGLYLRRPACELMLLTQSEHRALHSLVNNYMQGKHHSAEARAKISAARKGKPFSEERKAKISAANKGKHWHKDPITGKRIYTD